MDPRLTPAEFIKSSEFIPVVDVRSPKEFAQGHIPGACNIPLFSDEERAMIGITYTRSGNRNAIMKGLEIVGPKLKEYVQEANKIAPGGELLLHCWRGGMRSEAMAWLFDFSGLKAHVLEGGYKSYRRFIHESFKSGPELKVLGGMTGSGKTEILKYLYDAGEQVIDLEGLANHKGSAFGGLGQESQPTSEQFENELANHWIALNPEKPVWIEDESLNIGKVILPDGFFKKMRNSPLYLLELSFEKRVQRLMEEYGRFDKDQLLYLVEKISKRMGGDHAKNATAALMKNNLGEAIEIVLRYYDKTYAYSLESRGDVKMIKISGDEFADHKAFAEFLKTIR
jgi:tRNA 2-selenouridine synthase